MQYLGRDSLWIEGSMTRYRVWEVHPGNCGRVTHVQYLGKLYHPGDCGCVTPGTAYEEEGHRRDCGSVNPKTVLGRVILETWPSSTRYELSPWKLWTCDIRCRVCRECYPEDCGHVTPGAGTSESSTWSPYTCDSR